MNDKQPQTLIVTVGTGRHRADIAKAIAFSLRHNTADHAVFLCSRKTETETLPLVLKEVDWFEHQYHVHTTMQEEDVQALFLEWNRSWDGWMALCPDAFVAIDFTSGTKAMSAAAVLLAVARDVPSLTYVTGNRDDTGRVIESENLISLVPSQVIAHRQLRVAVEHFHAGGFAAARDLSGEYLKIEAVPDDHLREVARSVHFLAKACDAWDRFDYKAANSVFHDSRRYWTDWAWVDSPELLEKNAAFVKQVRDAATSLTPQLCADLIGNAQRCVHRQGWDDAVARLYRACEMLAQIKLLRGYQIRTGNLDPAILPPGDLRKEYEAKQTKANGMRVAIGLRESYELLAKLDCDLGRKFTNRYGNHPKYGELHNLLEARNQSLLAHGAVPIKKDHAQGLLRHVMELAEILDSEIIDKWLPLTKFSRFRPF